MSLEDTYSLDSPGVQETPKRGPGPQGPTIIKEGRATTNQLNCREATESG